jgi:N-acyl-D-amino-acid deacylase
MVSRLHFRQKIAIGEKLPLGYVIRKQSHDTAQRFGLSYRGFIKVGKKADVNVIDMDALTLHSPPCPPPDGGRPATPD